MQQAGKRSPKGVKGAQPPSYFLPLPVYGEGVGGRGKKSMAAPCIKKLVGQRLLSDPA